MFRVNIYIETSIKGPGTRSGWYAAIIEYQMKNGFIHKRFDFGMGDDLTYHKSVLLVLGMSLLRLTSSSYLTIHTDSQYLIGIIERGTLEKWRKNNFKNSRGMDVKNLEEWKLLDKRLKGHKVEFHLTKGNKYSDELREKTVKRYEEWLKRQKNVDNSVENTENFLRQRGIGNEH